MTRTTCVARGPARPARADSGAAFDGTNPWLLPSELRIVELFGLCVMVLDRTGDLIAATSEARRMLADGTILFLEGRSIRARDAHADRALAALWRSCSSETEAVVPVRLEATGGGAPFLGLVLLDCDVAMLVGRAGRDLGLPSAEVLRVWFGLTPREAQLCRLVARGWSPERTARAMGVAPTTARVHLRNVFQKLRLSRQSELAFVVGSLPAFAFDVEKTRQLASCA